MIELRNRASMELLDGNKPTRDGERQWERAALPEAARDTSAPVCSFRCAPQFRLVRSCLGGLSRPMLMQSPVMHCHPNRSQCIMTADFARVAIP